MINDNTILSSFDDRPTLLEWLKKVEDALQTDTATAVSVENPSANTYVFKITFADGKTLSSGNVVFPNAVQDVSIKNGHIIVTQISGTQTDLGAINPYAGTIVENAETDTTEIGNNVSISGNVATGGNLGVTGQAVVGGRLQVNSSIISNGEFRGGNISGTKFLLGTEEMPLVKANPTGEATATLEKIKIGDVAYNVGGGGGGGSDYTAGNNIEISEAKAIAVKSALTGIDSINFAPNGECKITGNNGELHLHSSASFFDYPGIIFEKKDNSGKSIYVVFTSNYSGNQRVRFPVSDYHGSDAFGVFTRGGAVPPVPSTDGTYILKASVSGFNVTYTWELQQ